MLGVPYNVAFYSIFTHLLCAMCDLKAGRLYHTVGDAHIYANHVDQIKEQLSRKVNPESKPVIQLPTAEFGKSILDYAVEDIVIHGYLPGTHIAAPVAV